MHIRLLIPLATCWALVLPAMAASPLADLFLQVPAPPVDGPAATAWVREGKIVGPEFLNFESRLQQEKASPAKPTMAVSPSASDSPAALAAVRGFEAYRSQNSGEKDPAQVLAKRSAWITKRFDGVRKRMGLRPWAITAPWTTS